MIRNIEHQIWFKNIPKFHGVDAALIFIPNVVNCSSDRMPLQNSRW